MGHRTLRWMFGGATFVVAVIYLASIWMYFSFMMRGFAIELSQGRVGVMISDPAAAFPNDLVEELGGFRGGWSGFKGIRFWPSVTSLAFDTGTSISLPMWLFLLPVALVYCYVVWRDARGRRGERARC